MPIVEILRELLLCFIWTAFIEVMIAAIWMRNRRAVYAVLLCNLLTNPALNLILYLLSIRDVNLYIPALIILELGVLFGESSLLRCMLHLKTRKAFTISFVCNTASALAGILVPII